MKNQAIQESLRLLDHAQKAMDSSCPSLMEVRRYIHTIKGCLLYLKMPEVMSCVRDLEATLEKIRILEAPSCSLVKEEIRKLSALLNSNQPVLNPLPPASLRVKSFFASYPYMIQELAAEFDKDICFHLQGGELVLPDAPWGELFTSFVHFVRNSCDHGIETRLERKASGKKMVGTITFTFKFLEDELEIILSDDGKGMSWKELALKDLKIQTEEDVLEKVLHQGGFSSRDAVSDVSGRGLGLSAISEMTLKWEGRVCVKNVLGQGFTLELHIPLKNLDLKTA